MSYSPEFNNQRRDLRASSELPVRINVGSQLSLNGQLKDISLKSAFVRIKNNVYFQMNDEVGVTIQVAPGKEANDIEGLARISRIAVGEGVALYFTKMEGPSLNKLKKLLKEMGIE